AVHPLTRFSNTFFVIGKLLLRRAAIRYSSYACVLAEARCAKAARFLKVRASTNGTLVWRGHAARHPLRRGFSDHRGGNARHPRRYPSVQSVGRNPASTGPSVLRRWTIHRLAGGVPEGVGRTGCGAAARAAVGRHP